MVELLSAHLACDRRSRFIGGNFVLDAVRQGVKVVNLDALTYAGNVDTCRSAGNPTMCSCRRHRRCALIERLMAEHRPDCVINFAAESHVDRSIDGRRRSCRPTWSARSPLLEQTRDYWKSLDEAGRAAFRFLHVSTDEVYGSLGDTGKFTEETPYAPNSPYSASKAASDHLVRPSTTRTACRC
jgi:dTDP-glucose 4,6-dehydratase